MTPQKKQLKGKEALAFLKDSKVIFIIIFIIFIILFLFYFIMLILNFFHDFLKLSFFF